MTTTQAVVLGIVEGVTEYLPVSFTGHLKHGRLMLQTFDHYALIIGVAVAFIAAVISVKWMVNYLSSHGLEIIGCYRVIAAVVGTVFLLTSRMIWIIR